VVCAWGWVGSGACFRATKEGEKTSGLWGSLFPGEKRKSASLHPLLNILCAGCRGKVLVALMGASSASREKKRDGCVLAFCLGEKGGGEAAFEEGCGGGGWDGGVCVRGGGVMRGGAL